MCLWSMLTEAEAGRECRCVHGDANETGAQAVEDYGADGERRGHPTRGGASTRTGHGCDWLRLGVG